MQITNDTSAVVTGGASGLGEASARALAAAGIKVAIFDLNVDAGEAIAAEIGGIFCRVDVTDEENVIAGFARARAAREFVHAASVAHSVYAPERRQPVEVVAAAQQHLVQWLSKRLDRPLKVPDLSGLGYVLVGGRLLPGEDGARAQFMFENPAGERVTLYIGALDASAPGSRKPQETAFRFSADGPVPSFYWVDQGFGYAIAGKLPRETLMQLATVTYRQLS